MNVLKAFTTITITGVAAAAPQYIAAVPHDYQMLATALIAVLGAAYHLYQPSPSAPSGQ